MSKQPQSPPSSAHHRRIELQSPQDLQYLQSLGTKAAHTRLTTAFPPPTRKSTAAREEQEDDELRSRVNQLVDEFLDRTYAGVRINSTANGVILTGAHEGEGEKEEREEEFEEFDSKTAEKIRDLERRREKVLLKVASLRREGVTKAADDWKTQWESNKDPLEDEDVKMEEGEELTGEPVQLIDMDKMMRWEEMQKTHERGLEGLVGLKSGMAGTVGRLEEARRVGEELEGRR